MILIKVLNEVKALKNLADWLGDSTKNVYFTKCNIFNRYILRNIENWKIENGKYLENWLKTMGKLRLFVV